MKKSSRVILVLLTLLCMAFGFAACGAKVTAIKVGTAPRVQFVQGLDLDLTGGTIVVSYENKTEEIALNAEGVSVTGYEKDKLGEQTLTVSYEEFTTELKVTVVERMTISNATKEYFVGDEFDLSKGKISLRNDLAVATSVNLNAEGVSVTGFDSTTAGDKTVTVSYGGYSTQMTVKVHTPKVKFYTPTKTSYDSHETELSVLGGYFTLTAENSKLTRNIALTEDMVSGFDPSKATMEEHSEEALKQVLTVTFGEKEYTYNVFISYSDVSYFKAVAKELEDKLKELGESWGGDTIPAIPMDLAGKAYEGICRYLTMKSSEREYLTQEEIEQLVRPGVLYGVLTWGEAKKEYEGTIAVQGGNLYLIADSYEAVRADYDKLVLGTDDFVVIGKQLMKIGKEFGKIVVHGEMTVQKYVDSGYNFESFDEVLNRLLFMLDLYECLMDVPEDWDYEDLKTQSVKIENAKRLIINGGYSEYEFRNLFAIVGTWRKDFYNIMYSYYYEAYTEAMEAEDKTLANTNLSAINAMMKVYLPGPLEELYSYLNSAFQQAQYLKNQEMYDASYLFYDYYNIMKIVDEVEAMEDDIYSVLYNQCGLKSMVFNYALKVDSEYGFGVFDMSGGWYADKEFTALWDEFNGMFDTLYAEIEESKFIVFAEFAVKHQEEMVSLFNNFANLSPSRQFGFISSLHANYLTKLVESKKAGVQVPSVFEYTVNPEAPSIQLQQNQFMFFVGNAGFDHYFVDAEKNATAGKQVFHNLIEAMEYYARAQMFDDEMENFYTKMEAAMAERAKITDAAEVETFNGLLGDVYNKYVAIYNQAKAETKPEIPTELQEKFDELVSAVGYVYAYYESIIASIKTSQFNPKQCGLLNVAYDKAEKIEKEILAMGEGAVNIYNYVPYKVGKDANGNDVYMTLEYLMSTARSQFVQINGMFHVSYTPFVEVYMDCGIKSVFAEVNEVLIETYLDEEKSFTADDKTAVEGLMQKIWAIDHAEWYIFETIGGAYYDGLYDYFKDLSSETALLAIAQKLFNLEVAYRTYLTYKNNPDAKYEDGSTPWEYFQKLYTDVKTVYDGLSEEDKAVYKFFFEYYQGLATATTETPNA